jgi:hypothetical protein
MLVKILFEADGGQETDYVECDMVRILGGHIAFERKDSSQASFRKAHVKKINIVDDIFLD